MQDRTGERKQNNVGRWMEIVAYRGARDIDVAFDDGSLVTNTT